MLHAALTGGIATGKSYVRGRFERLGVPAIDADTIARLVVEPGTAALAAIVSRFGSGVLGPDGRLDRRAVGRIVFADAGARHALESIVHPAVYAAIHEWRAALEATAAGGAPPCSLADIPLLYETGHESEFDAVIVTACAPAEQIRRLVARDAVSEEDARARLAAQWPIARKVDRADYVIRTDGTFEDTDRQVQAIHARLIAANAGRQARGR